MPDRAAWPRILVVTDRHRLVRRRHLPPDAWPDVLQAQIAGALDGGADLVQVREPDLEARALAWFLRRLFEAVPDSARHVVVNDRSDVAWVTGAAGVHLTERSLDLADIRRLRPADKKWVTGRSVHDPAMAARCRDASYLVAGTVQPSASKPAGWEVLGWAGLAAIVEAAGNTPVVAIGGLAAADAPAVHRAGAIGIAGIGCFLPDAGGDIARSVRARVQVMQKAFDSTGGEF